MRYEGFNPSPNLPHNRRGNMASANLFMTNICNVYEHIY